MLRIKQFANPNLYAFRLIISYVIIYVTITAKASSEYDLNLNSDAPRMIARAGYPVQSHFVTTEDGYIIEIHRIPGRPDSVPVFLQHGLFGSSNTWVLTGKKQALAYRLVDEGYDVWIGNIRGNTFGRAHVNMSVDDKDFFNFSIDEVGMYDLTAAISYVNDFTSKSIILIPFSMGSPMTLIMVSQRLDVQSKIRLIIHLAPAVFVGNISILPLKIAAMFEGIIKFVADLLGIREVIPGSWIFRKLDKYLCGLTTIQEGICREIVMSIVGFDRNQFPLDLVPMLLSYAPDTTSLMLIDHYAQWINTAQFQRYDYGENGNLEHYNTPTPPNYDITNVNIPNAIFYGDNDVFVTPEDARKLYDIIPNKIGFFRVNYTDFAHLDFRFAPDAPTLVYDHVIKIVKDYS